MAGSERTVDPTCPVPSTAESVSVGAPPADLSFVNLVIDWDVLLAAASAVCVRAHSPYSGHAVGVALLCEDGSTHLGVNVENAAYLALHAEWVAVGAAVTAGAGRVIALVCVSGRTNPHVSTPCGICRQLLMETGGPDMLVLTPSGPQTLSELLPDGFDAAKLEHDRDPRHA